MSRALLIELHSRHALDPVPLRGQLAALHVPWDELTGTNATEARLRSTVESEHRVALIGASGSGKSSTIAWSLDTPQRDVLAIPVHVRNEQDDVVIDPAAFARHIIDSVSRHASDAGLIDDDTRRELLVASTTSNALGSVSRKWSWGLTTKLAISPELRREVSTVIDDGATARSATEVFEVVTQLMGLIQAHSLFPVLVIDDSDAWLNIAGVDNRTHLADGFFTRVLRSIAELPCGLCIAVHDQYQDLESYRAATADGLLDQRVALPHLRDAGNVKLILAHRVHLGLAGTTAPDTTVDEVFTDSAIDALWNFYLRRPAKSVRRLFAVAQTALSIACDSDAELITADLIEAAIIDDI